MLLHEYSHATGPASDLKARARAAHGRSPRHGEGATDAVARASEAIDAARGNLAALDRDAAAGRAVNGLTLGFLHHNLGQARRWTARAEHPVLISELSALEAQAAPHIGSSTSAEAARAGEVVTRGELRTRDAVQQIVTLRRRAIDRVQ